MKITLSIITVLFFACSISSFAQKKPKFHAIEISYHSEIFPKMQTPFDSVGQSMKKITYGDFKLYVTPIFHRESSVSENEDGDIEIDMTGPIIDTTYQIYITKKNISYGLQYSKVGFMEENGIKLTVDSFLRSFNMDSISYKGFDDNIGKPANTFKKGKRKTDIFTFKVSDSHYTDSITRDFDKNLKSIDFSYSPRLDKLNNSKLYKTTYVNYLLPKEPIPGIGVIRQYLHYMVKKIEISESDKKLYLELITKFEKDVKSNRTN